MRVERSVVIGKPVDEVFAFLTDVDKLPLWVSKMVATRRTSDGPLAVGSTWHGVATIMGRPVESGHLVTAFEPDRRYAYQTTTSPLPGKLDYRFEAIPEGTRVSVVAEVKPTGVFRMAGPFLRRAGGGMYERSLGELKRLLESD